MKIDNNTIVQRIDSVFVSRAGKEDCIICKRTKHGFKESDGKPVCSLLLMKD
jgi:hypothetical protein